MPVIEFSASELFGLLGKKMDIDDLVEKIPQMGADVEGASGDKISVEFFPNRPDLYSVEGIARALRAFLGISKEQPKYNVQKSDLSMVVDPSVRQVRPYIAFAMVRGVDMDDGLVASLMNIQEKLHLTAGRDRAKVAIGIHDADMVQPPFIYRAALPSEGFTPLGKDEWMSMADILRFHEKGKAYAWILEGAEKYPLISDKMGNILSFPPIINGTLTAVTSRTKNLLVDVTGTDERAVELCLNILVAAIADRGGKIFSVEVVEGDKRKIYPRMEPREHELDLRYAREIIGVEISEDEACKALSRMGHAADADGGKITVRVPAYRGDIIHGIDLVEDLAIGYGYGNIGLSLPQEYSFGKEQNVERKCKILRKALSGLGYQEVMTFVLSGNKIQFESMAAPVSECVKTENPVTEDYSIMRTSVLPCLLDLFKANKHRELPQAIFEIGDIVDPYNYRNVKLIAGAKISAKANFTEMKSDIDAVMRAMGAKCAISEKAHPSFVPGRCASVSVNGKEIGVFGEVSPQVISNFELGCPLIAFEFKAAQI